MKKIFIFLVIINTYHIYAQVDVSGGMGISFVNSSSFTDYVNMSFAPSSDKISTFYTTVNFFAEADYTINENFQLGIEYLLLIYSYNTSIGTGIYDIAYNYHKPSILAYYVIPGNGFKIKLGGGAGYRIVSLTEKLPTTGTGEKYSSAGFGVVLKLKGDTAIGENLYANIGLDARYDLPGEPNNSNKKLFNNALNENVDLNSLSFGISLGVSYFF